MHDSVGEGDLAVHGQAHPISVRGLSSAREIVSVPGNGLHAVAPGRHDMTRRDAVRT